VSAVDSSCLIRGCATRISSRFDPELPEREREREREEAANRSALSTFKMILRASRAMERSKLRLEFLPLVTLKLPLKYR